MIKNSLLLLVASVLLFSCGENTTDTRLLVNNLSELNKAIEKASPGDNIILANGVWKDVEIKFRGKGTEDNPIT